MAAAADRFAPRSAPERSQQARCLRRSKGCARCRRCCSKLLRCSNALWYFFICVARCFINSLNMEMMRFLSQLLQKPVCPDQMWLKVDLNVLVFSPGTKRLLTLRSFYLQQFLKLSLPPPTHAQGPKYVVLGPPGLG